MPDQPNPPPSQVHLSVLHGIATIVLDAPERKNALSVAMVNALGDSLEAAISDEAVRLIVITNTGNTFCAGADLKADRPGISDGDVVRWTFIEVMQRIMTAPKPVIGRGDGHVTGGGVGLIAACDISVLRADAKIGFTEARLGVSPAVISVVCLPKMRRADASELFLTAERFSAARAVEVGLINAAVPASELDDKIEEYVDKIVRSGPMALAACKELIARVPYMTMSEGFEFTGPFSAGLFASDEAQAGIAAFRERRPAPWIPPNRIGEP